LQAEAKPTQQNLRPWLIGGVIFLVIAYFVWNAVAGGGNLVITSGTEYRETLDKAERLSLKHLQDLDAGKPLEPKDKRDLAEAAKLFDALSVAQATNIAPFMGAGKIYQALGQDEVAIQRFVQGLSTVPEHPVPEVLDTAIESHYLLSVSYFNLKQYDSALQEVDNAIKMFGRPSPIYLTQRARIYIEKRQYEVANDDLVAALKTDPTYQPAQSLVKLLAFSIVDERTEAAKAALNQKKYDEVVKAASQGLAVDPRNPALLALRGAAYLSLGKRAQAKQDADMLLLLDPDSGDGKTLADRLR
jgi:tetratricopeptide (TPR) repeat protein